MSNQVDHLQSWMKIQKRMDAIDDLCKHCNEPEAVEFYQVKQLVLAVRELGEELFTIGCAAERDKEIQSANKYAARESLGNAAKLLGIEL